MNEIKIFNSPRFGEIRTAKTESGEPLFHATDIAKSLGYENPAEAISTHCKSGNIAKCYIPHTNGLGGVNMQFIPETEVYRLVMRSKLPDAEKFQDWVCEEVLPSIRKTGGYVVAREEDTPEVIMARALFVAKDAIDRQKMQLEEKERQLALSQKQLEYQAPFISYANEVLSSKSDHTATTIAAQFNMSAVTLNKLLLKAGFIRKTRGEYSIGAKYQGMDYTVTTTFKYQSKSTGDNLTSIGLRFTERGRKKIFEIVERAKKSGVLKEVKGRFFMNNDWKPSKTA